MSAVVGNAIVPVDNNNLMTPEVEPNKRRRKKSIVWEYFTIEPVSAGCSRACCKQCKKTFSYISGSKQAGTSHLKRHISLGICPANRINQENNQQLIPYNPSSQNGAVTAPPRKRCRASPGSVSIALDQEHYLREIARMIILHDYPTNIVEQPGFVNFSQTLLPNFSMVSLDSVNSEIVCIYRREKQMLVNVLSEIPGRVSLTMDLWTSDQTMGYALLTGHFIDTDWRLKHRILKFVTIPFPESEVAFNHAVLSCLSEWNLESKLFVLTLDQSFASESVIRNLRGLLSLKNTRMMNGQYLIADCYSHVLTRLAQEVLCSMKESVARVRNSVKYVKAMESREEMFNQLRQQLQVPSTKGLVIDNVKRWDSTYQMLSTACELKEVFSCLDTSDPNYKQTPSMEEWKCVEVVCAYLKIFLDGANILTSETSYPTSDVFFHEVYKVEVELIHGTLSEDPFVSNFVKPLYGSFDKYWRNLCVILGMAVAMDPRYKLKLVQFSFAKIFGEEADMWIRSVDEGIRDLYFEYIAQTLPLPSIHVESRYEEYVKAEEPQDEASMPHPPDGLSDFDVYVTEISENHHTKSELDQYLDESLLPRGSEEFDVVEWWKLHRIKYPTLSKMAADILSIPMATISGDSVFDTESKKLDGYRCLLRPATLEALVCANNWLQYGEHQNTSSFDFSTAIVKKEMT